MRHADHPRQPARGVGAARTRDAAKDQGATAEPGTLGGEHRRATLAHPGEEVGLMLVHHQEGNAVGTKPVAAEQRERLAELERQRLVIGTMTDDHRRRGGLEGGKRRHQSPRHMRNGRMPPAPRPSFFTRRSAANISSTSMRASASSPCSAA